MKNAYLLTLGLVLATTTAALSSCIFSKAIEATELQVGNMLSWSTVEEVSNEYFVIQRSTDGINFNTIGQVKGAGDSSSEQDYRYLDISTGDKKVFYLIKQIDFEGNSGQTHVVLVNRESSNDFVITGMSSTRTDKLFTASIRSAIEGTFEYQVFNMNKEVQKSGMLEFVKGANLISIDLSELKNSKYTLTFAINDEVEEVLIKKVDSKDVPKIDYVIKEE